MNVAGTITGPPICVALDTADPAEALRLANALGSSVGAVKVGLTAFVAGGPSLVADLRVGNRVFLDLKLHDIPAQVGGAVGAVGSLGASLVTVHAAGGRAMLGAAAEAAPPGLTVVAVTVLTSLEDWDLTEIGMSYGPEDAVLRLADLALSSGVRGLVCSPLEVAPIRERFGAHSEGGPYLVVPGIRPDGVDEDDQHRTRGPKEALDAGADLLVIGRPITAAADPTAAARAIVDSL